MIDLDAYLARIGYHGPRTPELTTLRAVHRLHPAAIPFENLDPYLRRPPPSLEPAALEAKLVAGGRGGWCFEHNSLLGHALAALGFRTTPLAGRVVWSAGEDAVTARTHMILRIDLDGQSWLADVGFGVMTLTAPLRLVADVEQETAHEPFRLVRRGEEWLMQARIDGGWRGLYRFDLAPQQRIDHEVASWWLCTHPASHFLSTVIAARTLPDRRIALRGAELAVHHLRGASERRRLGDVAELRRVLADDLGIRLPDGPELDAALAGIVSRHM